MNNWIRKVMWALLLCPIIIVLASCSQAPSVQTAPPTTPPPAPTSTPDTDSTEPSPILAQEPSPPTTPSPIPAALEAYDLPPFTVNTSTAFASTAATSWEPQPYAGVDFPLPLDPNQAVNAQVTAGLTDEQRAFLAENGFAVIHSQEAQFVDIRESVVDQGQAYFLTADSAFHSLHLTFDDLLKALERETLRPQMIAITQAVLDETLSYLPAVQGTSIEEDTLLAAAYLSVALRLFDPGADIDPRVEEGVTAQIEQIMAERGREYSVLLPGFEDDYGAYRPVGHYAGDVELEQYFRGMTWYGRVHFPLNAPDASRVPLIITLALRRAQVGGQSAAESWADVHEVLTFLIGPSDDAGPVEYAALMDEVYGSDLAPIDLADEALWTEFQHQSDRLPVPQINSTFVDWVETDMPSQVGWRFLGQRFTLDGFIFQNLVFDMVDPAPDGTLRLLPTGPDVMAVMGSEVALEASLATGASAYPNYLDQVTLLQQALQAQPESEWQSNAYSAWLYAFLPILEPHGSSYPAYMQTSAWAYREMNTALGSWAELKHDTILYTKMPEGAGGGGDPCGNDPPHGYVEANPEVFYRMAFVAQTIADGLRERGMGTSYPGYVSDDWQSIPLDYHIRDMETLAANYQLYGDIAARELAGLPLDDSDYRAIARGFMSRQEQSALMPWTEEEPELVPVVAAVAGSGPQEDTVLEVGTGYVDRIYVVVPIDGEMHIAQGGVYSYYEVVQPRSERLTDEEWRERLAGENAPSLPMWASNFVLPGGAPTDWTAFRIGDFYRLTEAGDDLNLRAIPSLGGEVLTVLSGHLCLEIIDGPVEADGQLWWQIRDAYSDEFTGWVVEDQEWYRRAP